MFVIIGYLVALGCIFGGYIIHGGNIAVVLHALPIEMMVICGGAIGAFIVNNPSNDFPTSVGYSLVSRDSLSAWIEGRDGGETRRIPYAYHRVSCEER